MNDRMGVFGVVSAVHGDPLSESQLTELKEADEVIITWTGGNGPHHYWVHHEGGRVYAVIPTQWGNPRMMAYNEITFVGSERYHTRVWRKGLRPPVNPTYPNGEEPSLEDILAYEEDM